jgi:multiple sugar transport system permease protein
MLGVGVLLVVVGILLLRSIGPQVAPNGLRKNLSPLVPFAGIILIGQGLLALRLKGRRLIAWFMALPAVTFILAVGIFPLLYSLGLSFIRWDLQVQERPFIFLQNYGKVLATARVWNALEVSIIIAVAAVALEFILGIGLALLLADELPGKSIILPILIMPLMMAPIVVGQTWRMLWSARFGAVNHFLSLISGQTVELVWLGVTKLAIPAIILTDTWQWTPFVFLIALAGLTTVNVELYEAAAIDGATTWQIFWRITLPIIRPVLLVALLFRLLDAMKIFDIVYILTGGGPGSSTETIPFYLYQQGFAYGRFGFTAAGSYLFLILVVIVAQILIRRIGEV